MILKLAFKYFIFFVSFSLGNTLGMFDSKVTAPIKFQIQQPRSFEPMEDVEDGFEYSYDSALSGEFKLCDDTIVRASTSFELLAPKEIEKQKLQKQLLIWIIDFCEIDEPVDKNKMLKWLSNNLEQIRQNELSGWFLFELKACGLHKLWEEVLIKLLG